MCIILQSANAHEQPCPFERDGSVRRHSIPTETACRRPPIGAAIAPLRNSFIKWHNPRYLRGRCDGRLTSFSALLPSPGQMLEYRSPALSYQARSDSRCCPTVLGARRLVESWLIRLAPGLSGQGPCGLISTQSEWTLVKISDSNRIWRVHLAATNLVHLGFRIS